MQVTAKIVYYGPGLCGKTSNLQHIHHKTAARSRGEMVSLETETDRTLFFDLLPLDVGVIGGMKVRLQLYTVPGQVFYNATRKLVLKGVDGVVFVADSQVAMQDANVESHHNLIVNLAELGVRAEDIPVVYQYNKRDLRNILSVEELNKTLNPDVGAFFEAAAIHGIGVFETLKSVSRLSLGTVRKKLLEDTVPGASFKPRPAATPTPPPPPKPAVAAPPPYSDPLAELITQVPPPEELKVEFAEQGTDQHVRAVRTKGELDIHQELEQLREMAAAPRKRTRANRPARASDRKHDMLVFDGGPRQEVRRKANVSVPAEWLRGAEGLRVHVAFELGGEEHVLSDVLAVRLTGNERLERLLLHLDLDLKKKS